MKSEDVKYVKDYGASMVGVKSVTDNLSQQDFKQVISFRPFNKVLGQLVQNPGKDSMANLLKLGNHWETAQGVR